MTLRIATSKKYMQEFPHALGEHAFLFTLFLIALAGGISAFVFFSSVLSNKSGETETQAKPVELRKDVFDSIVKERVLQDQRTQNSLKSLPKDIFRP